MRGAVAREELAVAKEGLATTMIAEGTVASTTRIPEGAVMTRTIAEGREKIMVVKAEDKAAARAEATAAITTTTTATTRVVT